MGNADGQWLEGQQSLISGIQDEITLDRIVTKLHWLTLRTLAKVNKSWRRAVQSRHVHEIRMLSGSTQTLVPMLVVDQRWGIERHREAAVALYDNSTDKWLFLPPIPGVEKGITRGCECICLQGKLYVLGGFQDRNNPEQDESSGKEVHVLDLAAGGTSWVRCADMTFSRAYFRCDHSDGKIYVFGGLAIPSRNILEEVETFDAGQNVWRVISPMKSMFHNVARLGKKFYLYTSFDQNESDNCHASEYNPATDQWTCLTNFARQNYTEICVEIRGKIYKIDLKSIHVHDEVSSPWIPYQSVSWQLSDTEEMEFLIAVRLVDDELIALGKIAKSSQLLLFKSMWFGTKDRSVVFARIGGGQRFVYWQGSLTSLHL